MARQMILTALNEFPLVGPGDDLAPIILASIDKTGQELADGDVIVLAQKIISKAEDRYVNLEEVSPSSDAEELSLVTGKDPRLTELVLRESQQVLRTRPGVIIVRHRLGFVCANAGIDHSNVSRPEPGEWVLLLPEDPDRSAATLRKQIEAETGVRIGVVVIDSHGRAWRNGTVGVSIGLSGIAGLLDLRGKPDLFGNILQITQVGLADELAAAASVLMGQADESCPAVLIRGNPYPDVSHGSLPELIRPESEDLFL